MNREHILDLKSKMLHPTIYSRNPLFGKFAMEITHECNEKELLEIALMPMKLGNMSTRQSNRMLIVACNAILELDMRQNGISNANLSEGTQEQIIKSAVKLLKKDLPMRARAVVNLYTRAFVESGLRKEYV